MAKSVNSMAATASALAQAGLLVSVFRSTRKDDNSYIGRISKDNLALPIVIEADSAQAVRDRAEQVFAQNADLINRVVPLIGSNDTTVHVLSSFVPVEPAVKRGGNHDGYHLKGKVWLHRLVNGVDLERIRVLEAERDQHVSDGWSVGKNVPKTVEPKVDGRTGERLKGTFWVHNTSERKRVGSEAERDQHVADGWTAGRGHVAKAEPVAVEPTAE